MFCWMPHRDGGPEAYAYTAVAVGHQVFSFVGSHDRARIEVHVFNTVSSHWMTLPPVTSGSGEHHLECHTAVLIEDVVYIWGGWTDPGYSNVLYAFDVDAHRWFKPRVSGNVPDARSSHSACVLGKVMYVHGECNYRIVHDIYKLDTTTMVWSLINTRGTSPFASYRSSATIIGTKMFVFGGQGYHQGQGGYNNVIRVFDTETNCWLSTPSAQLLPEGRMSHSAFASDGELYIFGGRNWLNKTFSDLWKYNPETFSWKKVRSKGNVPSSKDACCCMVGNRIMLFGGQRDYLYVLDLSPSLKTLCKLAAIQYGLEQSELPHNIRWELAAMTTNSKREDKNNTK